MRKSIVVLSVLLMVLFYCPSGTVAMATDDSETSLEDNLFTDELLSNEAESSSTGQTFVEKDKDLSVAQTHLDNESSFSESLLKKIADNTGEKEDPQMDVENETQREQIEGREQKTADVQASGLRNLQIPQKMDVVIDPWEIDGKGQVYSDVYFIRNIGNEPGVLTLSNLVCRPREQSRVTVKTDRDGIHDSDSKCIYMEMLFGNGNRIIFSSEKSQYQTELKPGEELSVCFSGEVNENAFEKWVDQDVMVSVVYSWEAGDMLDGLDLEEKNAPEKDGQTQVTTLEESADNLQTEIGREKPADCQHTDENEEESVDRQQADENKENSVDDQQADERGEEPADTQKADMSIESEGEEQKTDSGEGKIVSNLSEETDKGLLDTQHTGVDYESIKREEPATNIGTQYDSNTNINTESEKEADIAYNIEENRPKDNLKIAAEDLQINQGIVSTDEKEKEEIKNMKLQESQNAEMKIDFWKIDENGRIVSPQYLLCNAGDTLGTLTLAELICKPQEPGEIKVMADKNGLNDSEGKSVYMEFVSENGEKVVLSQENSMYEVKLEPGEKLAFRFIGEANGNLFENREEGDIVVTAIYYWHRE